MRALPVEGRVPSNNELFRAGPNRTSREYLLKAIFTNDKQRDADMMAQYIVPGTCVIDVGSHVGYFSRRFADRNPGGIVLAFEPQSVPRSIATVSSFFRRQRGIVQFAMALGAKPDLVELKIPIKDKGQIGIGLAHTGDTDDLRNRFAVQREIVCCQTLDAIMERIPVERVSLIKIDVEGGELSVLRGATTTLKRHRPVVVAETGDAMSRFGDSIEALHAFMKEMGYRAVDLRTGLPLAPHERAIDTVFLPPRAWVVAESAVPETA